MLLLSAKSRMEVKRQEENALIVTAKEIGKMG